MDSKGLWALVFLLLLSACTEQRFDVSQFPNGKGEGIPTGKEAAEATFRFAFSGQVVNAATGDPVKQFSVQLAGYDSSVNSILNALGDRNGIFHISRTALNEEASYRSIPVVITASGFEPRVQMVDLGSDCDVWLCAGAKPTLLSLKPIAQEGTTQSKSAPSTRETSEAIVFFSDMTNGNRTEELVSGLLAGINSDSFKNLSGALMGTAPSLIPVMTAKNPQVSNALLSVNTLLPYLTPILVHMAKNSGEKSPMGSILTTLLTNKDFQSNMLSLLASYPMPGPSGKKQPQLAMASLMPLVEGFLRSVKAGDQAPFSTILSAALKEPRFMMLLTREGDDEYLKKISHNSKRKRQSTQLLMAYLQPLLQGLLGKQAPEVASLFNDLVKDSNLFRLRDLLKDADAKEKYAKLLPYIEPLIAGLNSKDAKALARLLEPIVSHRNPSLKLASFLTSTTSRNSNVAIVAAALFPALNQVLTKYVPDKQLFTAQLLQGLVNGDIKNVNILQDLKGSPAVVVSGTEGELAKISQFQNVQSLVALRPLKWQAVP